MVLKKQKRKRNSMEYLIVFGSIILVSGLIAWRWVVGIDYMQKNHPDYKGDDFLNWDDNKSHTEGEL